MLLSAFIQSLVSDLARLGDGPIFDIVDGKKTEIDSGGVLPQTRVLETYTIAPDHEPAEH
jgi:hypothetical protein